jgi:hypothetical protein
MSQHGTEMQECIDNCTQCHNICVETINHCLEMGGKHADATHIRILQDCAQACETSTDFMLRGSDLHPQTCGVCADACERCAESCEELADGDEQMLRCAAMCRTCAASCREMASAAA